MMMIAEYGNRYDVTSLLADKFSDGNPANDYHKLVRSVQSE